jgi:hypothetical protein
MENANSKIILQQETNVEVATRGGFTTAATASWYIVGRSSTLSVGERSQEDNTLNPF